MSHPPKTTATGHRSFVDGVITRPFVYQQHGCELHIVRRTQAELGITNHTAAQTFFKPRLPVQVVLCGAKIGSSHFENPNQKVENESI
jgi:hypothetical protein